MSISKKMTSLTGAALAATAGAMVIANTPSLRLVAHADETHDQNEIGRASCRERV